MTHEQQRIYLIEKLLAEEPAYRHIPIPAGEQEQKDLLRSLMNLRPPKPLSREFIAVQDEYLQAERDQRGVTDSASLQPVPLDSRIVLWQGDITTLRVDAIVNAANSALLGCFHPLHGCIDNMVHTRSGIQLRLLLNERMQGRQEPTGRARITPAFNLPSHHILHTVGPVISGPVTGRDRELLASCYRSCLQLAVESGCQSVAFCCISTGEFHFPNGLAAEIAVGTVRAFLDAHPASLRVIFDVYKDLDLRLYQRLLGVSKC